MALFDKIIEQFLTDVGKFASFSIRFPDGTIKKAGDEKDEFIISINSSEVYSQVALKGSFALAEQYMLGNIDVEGDFEKVLELSVKVSSPQQNWIFYNLNELKYKLFANTKHRSLQNVREHYDLGNDLFEKFLDPTMAYSCAYFKTKDESLDQAQLNKYENICRKLMLQQDETLLDIGCGWGGLLIYSAKHFGTKGTGVTLSKQQYNYATNIIKQEGLQDKIQIQLKDYRDLNEVYDKVVSIEMLEAVRWTQYDEYFSIVSKCLKPGGIGLIQTISTINSYHSREPWFNKYIFPGGELSMAELVLENANKHELYSYDVEDLRVHYALTLAAWIEKFEANTDYIQKEYGEAFVRMWRIYLIASKLQFLHLYNRLYQFTFSKGLNNELPLTRDYLYK